MILYAVIARIIDGVVLVDGSSPELKGNFQQVSTDFLQQLARLHNEVNPLPNGTRKTYTHQNPSQKDYLSYFIDSCAAAIGESDHNDLNDMHYFHLFVLDGVYYGCLGDDPEIRDQNVAFAFLDAISGEFTQRYRPARVQNCNAYALQKQFLPNIRSQMHYHNTHHTEIAQEDRVRQLLATVDDMKAVMGTNLTLLMERGESMDRLSRKSQLALDEVNVFRKNAQWHRNQQMRKYYMSVFVTLVAISIFIYVLTVTFCGVGLKYCRQSN